MPELKCLYIVPTPIGNLEDITPRALRVLKEVILIACEDTRHSRRLLDHYHIHSPTTSYHEHNKVSKIGVILSTLERGDVALISDAGTPGISDPGYELIRAALAAGAQVEALPGANAAITALVASGLSAGGFIFLGFPPRKAGKLREFFEGCAARTETLILYESPNRLVETLQTALETLGDRAAAVALELTKMFEEIRRGTLTELSGYYQGTPPRGEVTIIIAGNRTSPCTP